MYQFSFVALCLFAFGLLALRQVDAFEKSRLKWLFVFVATLLTLSIPQSHSIAQTQSLSPVPYGVTSFGAAAVDGKVYLYGGHTGRPHSYSLDGISGKLLALDTKQKNAQWEELSTGPKLQGLAMVSHGGKLYRIGGLTIEPIQGENADGNSADSDDASEQEFSEDETQTKEGYKLYSVDTVTAFDPKTGKWSDLPPLPEPRSSHDAVVIDGSIFVLGGWNLNGDVEDWAGQGFRLDLSATAPRWTKLEMPETKRRAMSLAAANSKVYMIGGMSEGGDLLNEVAVYDINQSNWDTVADLPASGRLKGFGNSSFAVDGNIYCQTFDGSLRMFNPGATKWTDVETLEKRFFQRLLKLNDKQLIVIGGSNMSTGFTTKTELISIGKSAGTESGTAAPRTGEPENHSDAAKLDLKS